LKEVLEEVLELRAAGERFQVDLAQKHGAGEGGAPLGAFGMVHNDATMAFELLNFYFDLWGKLRPGPDTEVARVKRENGERVVNISKWLFVQTLSAIEYSAKTACAAEAGLLPLGGGRIYLRKIVESSRQEGWINDQESQDWDGVVEIRNSVVHNNAIADVNRNVVLPNTTLELVDGEMIRGDLLSFVRLTSWSVEAFSRWSDAFLKRWAANGR
jgi:hypothetical protein